MSNEMQGARVREGEGARLPEGEGARVQECKSERGRGLVLSLSHSPTLSLFIPLTLALFFLLPNLLRAQEIIITLNIIPPYSAYVYDYADLSGQAVITLTNTTQDLKQVRMEGILANATSGLFVRTNQGHRGPSPIIVPPGGSVVLSTQPGVMDFLDPQNVTTNADQSVEQAIVQTGQLPEGMYRLCVEAYDYNGPQLLSQPGGGCFSFGLYYANPPIITQPVNGTEISAYMTNPVFSWTPPLGNLAGALIEYDLLVTPVFPGQNPNDAIIAARTYQRAQPVLLKEGLMANVYVRQVFDLAFEQGKQYAMQVTARDRNGVVGISNLGRSEISVFTVGAVDTPVIPYSGTAPSGPIIDPGISPAFLANTLTGKLHYFWHNPANFGGGTNTGGGGTINTGVIGQLGDAVSGVNINDENRNGYSGFTQSPLAGVTVQLIQGIQFQSAPSTTTLAGPLLPGNILLTHTGQFHILNQPNMSAPTLATATTDGQGNFVFNVPNVQQLDFGWKQGTVTLSGDFTGNLEGSYTGTFRRVLMVRVGNPARTFYAQPVQFNKSLPTNGDLGIFYAQVKSYDTKVLVAERQDITIKKAGLRVYLLRKANTKPTLVPKDEGKRGDMSAKRIITVNLVQYEVLDSAITASDGMAEFRDLVRFDCSSTSNNNLYYIWSKPEDAFFTQHSVHNSPQPVNYMYQSDWSNTACYNPATGAIAAACMKCNLATRDGFSTISRSHPRAFKGQDQWLFNVNRVVAQNPRVTAFVKNSASGTQSGMAMNEPGVTWRLWRLNRAAADHLRSGNASWGAMLENNQPDGFIMAQNALTGVGKPMVLQEMGATGSDGRIHSGFLPVQMNGSNEQIGNFYVLDLQKPGFHRKIHVVNRIVLPTGTQVSPGQIGSLPNALGLLGGTTSGGGSGTSGSTNSAPPPVGDVAMLRRGYQYHQNELWMTPSSTLTLTFIDPTGNPVKCNSYYWDHVLGVEGVMQESQTIPSPRAERRVMQVPGSSLTQLRVVVIPSNSDLFQRDTIMVSVPVGASVNHTVTVPYRLHRIHFVVREKPANNGGVLHGQAPATVGPAIANARVLLVGTNAQMFPNEKHPNTNPGGAAASVAGNVYERITDSQGRVDFAFKASAGESFTFRLMTPTGGPYVTQEVQVSSTPGKRWQVKNVQLERGRTVRGRVMIDSAVVAGAKVRWERGGLIAEATTNAQGEYELTNVPQGHCKFYATKSPYIGMEMDEGQPSGNSYGTVASSVTLSDAMNMVVTMDFQLRVYAGMDFSSILGFPLEVTAFQEQPADRAQISGWITVPDSSNGMFRITQLSADGTDLRCVRFLNTSVEKDMANSYTIGSETVSPTKPVNLPMSLGVNEVAIGLYPASGQQPFAYHGSLRDTQTGIALDRPAGSDTRGAVMGGVRVASASFTDNNFALSDATISIVAPQGGMRLAAFASDARSWYPAGEPLNVANAEGQPFNYVLHGFQANSVTSNSYLYRDSLVLDTRIHTALEHIPAPDNDLNLAIGRIRIAGGQLQSFSGPRSFTVPLGQFSLQGTQLSMNNSGFGFQGMLNASGMELQVENGTLEPHRFLLGEMSATNMTLMGSIPVNATRPAEFGYDAVRPQPAWYVVVTSRDENVTAATISGQHLDGIPDNRDVPITSIWLYSNGAQEVALRNGIPGYDFFGITQFHLQSMLIGPTVLTLSGELDFGIPGIPTFTTALLYNKTPNGISGYTLQDFAMPPVGLNGVQLAFNKGAQRGSFGVAGNQHCIMFAQGQVTIKGVISDQDPNVFKNLAYTLVKTNQQTKLTVDRNPQQSVRLGGDNPASRILMTDVEGEMTVVNGSAGPEWNTFYIKGNMPADMGFEAQNGQPQRMRFEVRGDLAVENQQVKLKDIETPFGNINMVYDMQHHRLSGQLNVSHGVSNGPSMSGAAAIVIDKEGFYFMSGLNVSLPDPQITGMAFILLGDYAQRTPQMDALLMQYSLHVQKKMEREIPAFLISPVQQLLAADPVAGVPFAQGLYPSGNLLPPTYLGLFGSGRFNGFYFNAGAQIPLPVIPNFSIDCEPVATLEMGCDGGIDVRFGANFGSGTYGVGFDTYVDIYMAGGASAGIICAYGRIGLYLTVGLDGVFQSNGNYTITGNGAVQLEGNVTVGGGMCSVPCNDVTCLHFNVGGSIGLGMQAVISNSGSNFEFTMGSNGTSSQRNDPPPQEN